MTTLKELETKRIIIKEKLNKLAIGKLYNGKMMAGCKIIGDNLCTSTQTVYNYINGGITDGYLADAIYKELKALTAKQLIKGQGK